MYRILVKKPQMAKGTYSFYSEVVSTIDEETEEVTKTTTVFETDSMEELEEKYKSLLATYTTTDLMPVDMLDVDLTANITDTTN